VPTAGTLLGEDAPTINFAALDTVIEWATSQAGAVQLAVVEYLEEPDDPHLDAVLDLIDQKAPTREARKETPLAQLIVRALPATMEALYALGRRQHRSNRPEAAVRQTVRSLKKRGLAFEDERGTIRLVKRETASSVTQT